MKRLRDHFSGVKCMKKLFRAQGYVVENPPPAPPDEANFSVESRYSDEDSEIKNILGSGQRDSRYVIKSDEESPRKSKCRKIISKVFVFLFSCLLCAAPVSLVVFYGSFKFDLPN